MQRRDGGPSLWGMLALYALWLLITGFWPPLPRGWNLGAARTFLSPATPMTLLLIVTAVYARVCDGEGSGGAFNVSFQKPWRNLLWAIAFAALAMAVLAAYQFLVVMPLTRKAVTASAQAHAVLASLAARLFEYLYVVYEGIIEVLIFVGFLLDRLAKKWGWTWAVVVSNVAFALWHFNYWRQGWLTGSLMIVLTFLAGVVISLSYVRTRNALTPVLCHWLVDSPNAVRSLLGIAH